MAGMNAQSFSGLKIFDDKFAGEFEPGDAQDIAFDVRGAKISYDVRKEELSVNDLRAPAPLRSASDWRPLAVFL